MRVNISDYFINANLIFLFCFLQDYIPSVFALGVLLGVLLLGVLHGVSVEFFFVPEEVLFARIFI